MNGQNFIQAASLLVLLALLFKSKVCDSEKIKYLDELGREHVTHISILSQPETDIIFDDAKSRVANSASVLRRRRRRLAKIESKIRKSKILWFPGSEETKTVFPGQFEQHPLFSYTEQSDAPSPSTATKTRKNVKQVMETLFQSQDSLESKNSELDVISEKYDINISEPHYSQVTGIIQSKNSQNAVVESMVTTFDDIVEYDNIMYNLKQNQGLPTSDQSHFDTVTDVPSQTPFATDDLHSILSFSSQRLICSTLHFHDAACDLYFNQYSSLQEFGLLYASNPTASVPTETSKNYISTSDLDLSSSFFPKSGEMGLRAVYEQIVGISRIQNSMVEMQQHILQQHFSSVYNEYFGKHPSKSKPLKYEGKKKSKSKVKSTKTSARPPPEAIIQGEGEVEDLELILQQFVGMMEKLNSQGPPLDPYGTK